MTLIRLSLGFTQSQVHTHMQGNGLNSLEAKAFVPARDFELSKRFYQALGLTLVWSTPELAHFRRGSSSFLLQNFHIPERSGNFAMHLLVEGVDSWWSHWSVPRRTRAA